MGIGYWLGKRRYDNPNIENAFKSLRKVISNYKRSAKKREYKYSIDQLDGPYYLIRKSPSRQALLSKNYDENFYNWLSPYDQRVLKKKLLPWCDIRISCDDIMDSKNEVD